MPDGVLVLRCTIIHLCMAGTTTTSTQSCCISNQGQQCESLPVWRMCCLPAGLPLSDSCGSLCSLPAFCKLSSRDCKICLPASYSLTSMLFSSLHQAKFGCGMSFCIWNHTIAFMVCLHNGYAECASLSFTLCSVWCTMSYSLDWHASLCHHLAVTVCG